MVATHERRPVIIGIGGGAGHGKDTVAGMVGEYFKSTELNPYFLAFAKPLKDVSARVFGFTHEDMYTEEGKNRYCPEYDMTVRTILQKVGTDMFRDMIHKDIWLHCLRRDLEATQALDTKAMFIVSDVRFENEAAFLREVGDASIIKVVRSNKTISESSHPSETSPINEDHVVVNDSSLDDLQAKVFSFLDSNFRSLHG